MDIFTLLRIMARQWFVVVPGLILAVLLASQFQESVAPTYTAEMDVVLLTPDLSDSGIGRNHNPLIGATVIASEVLRVTLSNGDVREKIAAQGYEPRYEVITSDQTPRVSLRVEAETAARARQTLEAVLGQAQSLLRTRQLDIKASPEALLRLDAGAPAQILERTADVWRLRVVIVLIALALTAVASVAIERRTLQRRWRAELDAL